MGYANVDTMLDEIDSSLLYEWIAFENYEAERETRSMMQARADASVETMKKQRSQ